MLKRKFKKAALALVATGLIGGAVASTLPTQSQAHVFRAPHAQMHGRGGHF